ncbi:MAG TPA: hypothetical protein VFS39_04850 [Nitrospira sp.]|nr:hypothetical protein [Nitrospira sp.]
MTYRYNSLDIIVGVGMCAIMFGAALFVAAASGIALGPSSFQDAGPPVPASGSGSALLQPVLGQVIVDRALLQRRTDRITSAATIEWNRALQARRAVEAASGGSLNTVLQRALAVPIEHEARVQGAMGRQIVNFTRRGIRIGALTADQYLSDFNSRMIAATESFGQRLHQKFYESWQAMMGRWVVDAARESWSREQGVEERLGAAIVHVTQAKTALSELWAENQYQVGTVLAALDRIAPDPGRSRTAKPVMAVQPVPSLPQASESPDVPIGYLVAASLALLAIFFGALGISGSSREAKAVMEAKRESSRWVYRMAA